MSYLLHHNTFFRKGLVRCSDESLTKTLVIVNLGGYGAREGCVRMRDSDLGLAFVLLVVFFFLLFVFPVINSVRFSFVSCQR